MNTIIIETFDSEIDHGIWDLKTPEIRIEQPLRKALGIPQEITAYIEFGAASLAFIAAVLELIKAKEHGKPRSTKTIIHTRKSEVDLKKLVARYEESIHVEIEEEDGNA